MRGSDEVKEDQIRQTEREQPVDIVTSGRDEGNSSQRMHECYRLEDGRPRARFLYSEHCLHQLLLQHDAPASANAWSGHW